MLVVFLIASRLLAVGTGLRLSREPDLCIVRIRVSLFGIIVSKIGRSSGQQARMMAVLICLNVKVQISLYGHGQLG